MSDILPAGMTIEDVILILATLSSMAIMAVIWSTLLQDDSGARRMKALAEQRDAIKAGLTGPVRRQKKHGTQTIGAMTEIVSRLKLLKTTQAEKVTMKLTQAGWRTKDAVIRYFFLKLFLPFGFGGLAIFLIYGGFVGEIEGMLKPLLCVGGFILGIYAPDIHIKNAIKKREDLIRKALPDALDLMVICAEAGLSLDATMSRVSKEVGNNCAELADELGLTSVELGFLPDRREALKNLALRCTLSTLRGMVNSLLQAERYGTPLANSLRVLSAESRNERMMKAEEKAARLPALMTVPMIIFILPPLFIVLLGPAILSTIDALGNM